MKNIVIVLLLFPFSVFGDSFKSYLSYTDKAEAYITQDDYRRAEGCYDIAFHVWKKPFAIDVYNALKCANLNKDYAEVKLLATRLMSLGCTLSFFEDPGYLTAFRCTPEWRSLINEYAVIRAKYVKENNWKLRTEVEQMLPADQFLRQQDHNYTFLRDSIYNADDAIKTRLRQMFKTKFPNEYDYGVFLSDDTTIQNWEPLHIVILHNYGKFDTADVHNANMSTYDFTSILQKAVEDGNMHPEEFALLNDRAGKLTIGNGYGQMALLVKIRSKLYYEKQVEALKTNIDQNRANIGLCDREQGRSKLMYNAKWNKNRFILRKSAFGISDFGDVFPERVIQNIFVYTGVSVD